MIILDKAYKHSADCFECLLLGIGKTSLVNKFLTTPEITKLESYPDQIEEPSSFFSSVETSSKHEGVSEDSDYDFEGIKEIWATTARGVSLPNDQEDGGSCNIEPEYNICLIDTVGYGAYLDVSLCHILEHAYRTIFLLQIH